MEKLQEVIQIKVNNKPSICLIKNTISIIIEREEVKLILDWAYFTTYSTLLCSIFLPKRNIPLFTNLGKCHQSTPVMTSLPQLGTG